MQDFHTPATTSRAQISLRVTWTPVVSARGSALRSSKTASAIAYAQNWTLCYGHAPGRPSHRPCRVGPDTSYQGELVIIATVSDIQASA
jgi:hypothetical protein